LTAFESEVMAAVRGVGTAGAAEVRAALLRAGHDHPYTTVASALQRLYQRGLLERDRERVRGGLRYTFRVGRAAVEIEDSMIDRMAEAFGASAVLHLLDAREEKGKAESDRIRHRVHQDP
jgi:predicted transcriptional regulator